MDTATQALLQLAAAGLSKHTAVASMQVSPFLKLM